MSKVGGEKWAVGSHVNEDVGVLNGIMWSVGIPPLSLSIITAFVGYGSRFPTVLVQLPQ